jgi:hypothetical protein
MRAKSPFPSETGAKTPIPLTIKLIIRSSTCIYELDFLTIKNGEVWSKNKSLFDSISQCIKKHMGSKVRILCSKIYAHKPDMGLTFIPLIDPLVKKNYPLSYLNGVKAH